MVYLQRGSAGVGDDVDEECCTCLPAEGARRVVKLQRGIKVEIEWLIQCCWVSPGAVAAKLSRPATSIQVSR